MMTEAVNCLCQKQKAPFFIKEDAEEIAVYQGLALPTSDNNQTIHALV